MKKKQLVKDILSLIHNQGLEKEIIEALTSNQQNVSERKEKTSNGYQIYYDEATGKAVGIVYKNMVFLKNTSKKKLHWYDAAIYCKTVVINGITSRLCPADESWKTEFKKIAGNLYKALLEIGAENLDDLTWAAECNANYAWSQSFGNGNVTSYGKTFYSGYVRPVLILDKKI